MHPTFITVFGVEITTYGLLVAIAFLTLWFSSVRYGRRLGYSPEFIQNLLTLVVIFSMIGARLLYIFIYWEYFKAHPREMIFSREGYVFLGGFIGAVLISIWYARRHKHSVLGVADLFAPYAALAHGIGRIGCFLFGCCFGGLSGAPWAIRFPKDSPAYIQHWNQGLINAHAQHSLPIHPTQLYETAGNFAIFAILILVRGRQTFRGQLAMGYLMLYGGIRFVIEIYRADPRGAWGALSTSQWISLAMIALGAWGYYALLRKAIPPERPLANAPDAEPSDAKPS